MGSSRHQIYCNYYIHLFRPIYTNLTILVSRPSNIAILQPPTQKSPSTALPPPRPALRAAGPHHCNLTLFQIPPSYPIPLNTSSLSPTYCPLTHPPQSSYPPTHQPLSLPNLNPKPNYLNHPTTHVPTRRTLPKTRQDPPRPPEDQSHLSPNQYRAPNPPTNQPADEPLVSYGACQGPCAGRGFSSKRDTPDAP